VLEKLFPGKLSSGGAQSHSTYWHNVALVPFESQPAEASYRAVIDLLHEEFHFLTYYLYLHSADNGTLWLEYMDLRYDHADGAVELKKKKDLISRSTDSGGCTLQHSWTRRGLGRHISQYPSCG